MGKRWKNRLPELLTDRNYIEVRSSSKPRSIVSGEEFLTGILGHDIPPISEDNQLLRFYDYCPKFEVEVEENEETFKQQILFKSSAYFLELISEVEQKTGLTLEPSQVDLMWNMCR